MQCIWIKALILSNKYYIYYRIQISLAFSLYSNVYAISGGRKAKINGKPPYFLHI